MKWLALLCLVIYSFNKCSKTHAEQQIITYPIGGLFNKETSKNAVNAFASLVKNKEKYVGNVIYPEVTDSYSTALYVCANTPEKSGIIALLDGRPTHGVCDTTCLISNRLNISHLVIDWEPVEPDLEDETYAEDRDMSLYPYSLYYHPPPEYISKAYAAFIKQKDWDKFTILYEDEGSFIRNQEVINTWPSENEPILYRKLDPKGDNRETLKYIFKVSRMSHIILDCHANNLKKYMTEIIQVENATEYLSFLLTSLDAYTLDFKEFPLLMANVSTFHLNIKHKDLQNQAGFDDVILETALIADALAHLEKAVRTLGDERTEPPSMCFADSTAQYNENSWPVGRTLMDRLLETELNSAFTGDIKFDATGRRTEFILHHSKLTPALNFSRAGSWDSTTNIVTIDDTVSDRSSASNTNLHIRVISKIGAPYFMKNDQNDTDEFKGYAVDLIKAIFEHINKDLAVGYTYAFTRESNDATGSPIPGTKKWNGIIGEIMDNKQDLAVCDLTITSERNRVVEFSVPFMSIGISILMVEPPPEDPNKFSFMKPFDLDVWLYLATAYIIVSFVLFICARMSQDDWVNPHPCNHNPENLQNIWTLYNSMWLTMGSIMTQGCDILPRAAGSRWITGVWWFFALIVTASYTANLSTFISNDRRSNEIKSAKELSEQTEVTYGAVNGSSTYKFFRDSNDTVYAKLWSVMDSAKPTVFTQTNVEGRDRVKKSMGKYAFFMESASIEYYTERDCDLKMVGNLLDAKDYGIAMHKGSKYKILVDAAILQLQESGDLEKLKSKWWQEENRGNETESCSKIRAKKKTGGSLQMKNTSGIFMVLGFGGVLGFIVAIIDFMMHSNKIAVKEKVTFKEALISEWKASFNIRAPHKPAAPPRSAAPSTGSPSPQAPRAQSRAVSVIKAAASIINFDEVY